MGESVHLHHFFSWMKADNVWTKTNSDFFFVPHSGHVDQFTFHKTTLTFYLWISQESLKVLTKDTQLLCWKEENI